MDYRLTCPGCSTLSSALPTPKRIIDLFNIKLPHVYQLEANKSKTAFGYWYLRREKCWMTNKWSRLNQQDDGLGNVAVGTFYLPEDAKAYLIWILEGYCANSRSQRTIEGIV